MKGYLIFVPLLLFSTVPVFASDNCFPGKNHVLSSPDHKHALVWKERQSDDEPNRLLYRKTKGSEPKELLKFDREICANWSPDKKYFAVTDYIGSNVTETYIYETDDASHPINVTDLLPEKVRSYFRRGILHGYVEALSWGITGLVIRAYGDRESKPRAFEVKLKCTRGQDTWTCVEE